MISPRTVVFDLDGTLVDTAPDLINALNHVLDREGLPPVPLHSARNMIGAGARRLIERGLELEGRSVGLEDINRLTRPGAGGPLRRPRRHQPAHQRFHRLLRRSHRRCFAPLRWPGKRARRSARARISLCGLHQQARVVVEASARSARIEFAIFRDLRRRHLRRFQA